MNINLCKRKIYSCFNLSTAHNLVYSINSLRNLHFSLCNILIPSGIIVNDNRKEIKTKENSKLSFLTIKIDNFVRFEND